MILTVAERLLTQNLIPNEGSFSTLKLIRVARENLSFTDEELKVLNMKQNGNRMVWNEVVPEKEIHIGETVTGMIVDRLNELNKTNKLPEEYFSLYVKFIGE